MKFRIYGEGHLAEVLRCELELLGLYGSEDTADAECAVAFIAQDVVDHGAPGLLDELTRLFGEASRRHSYVVVVSQVPPGWTRYLAGLRKHVYYQVDTIIVRRAVARMMHPEQIVVGCSDPDASLPIEYQSYLALHDCPVLQMTYEEAELAKCMINFALSKQIEVANVGSVVADMLGARWEVVAESLHNDARIGHNAYLQPGSTNEHLNRDVQTIQRMLDQPKN